MRSRGKILVIRGGAIGDFILTLPALAALKEQFPEIKLEILGYPHIAQLALAAGLADRIESIEARALAPFFAPEPSLPKPMAEFFAEFALIISYLYDPDEVFKTNVLRCSKAQFIRGPHRPMESEAIHATEVLLKPLERLAISADAVPRIAISVSEESRLPTGKWIAVHPGSGSERKNWPQASWKELLGRIIERTTSQLLLVGGEAEENRLEQLAADLQPARVHLAKKLPLPSLGELMTQCSLFLGHDSGITHLAAALGVEGLALWGETKEQIWRPGPSIRVVKHPYGLDQLPVENVWKALLETGRL